MSVSSGSMPKSLVRWLLVGLVLLSFGLYLWRIEAKGIWWDESTSLFRAQQSVPYILSNRIGMLGPTVIDQHPPLYFLLLHALTRVSGESDLVLRFLSVAFATLIVPILYALGVRLRGPRAGLLAALLGTLSPFCLWYAQEVRMYTMVTALAAAALYCLWRACAEHQPSWGWAAGLLAAAAGLTQYLFLLSLMCAIPLAYLLWRQQQASARALAQEAGSPQHMDRRMLLGTALLLLVLALIAFMAIRVVPLLESNRSFVPLGTMLLDAFNSFSLGLSADLAQVWILDIVFWLVFLCGVVSIWQAPPRLAGEGSGRALPEARGIGLVVLVAYIMVPILGMWLLSFINPVYMGSRYVLICSPAFYLGLGVGLDGIARRNVFVSAWLLLALVCGMCISLYRYHYDERYRAKEDFRAAAQYVAANERVGDALVVNGPESEVAFAHYYQGRLPMIGMPQGGQGADATARDLEAIALSCDRIWLLRGSTHVSDREGLVPQWMDAHTMPLASRRSFPGWTHSIEVRSYLPRSPVQEGAVSTSAPIGAFGERLALSDYILRYVDAAGQAQEIRAEETVHASGQGNAAPGIPVVPPGQVISVVLFWQPLAALDDYKTSLRLSDAGGTIRSQSDEPPFMTWPTSQWPVGATIRHETGVRIPQKLLPGVYHLGLVVYPASGAQALSYRPSAGEAEELSLNLGEIVVGSSP